jgi:hypothetical protein
MRASASMPPPGGYGTIRRIDGPACDHAGALASARSEAINAAAIATPVAM